MANLIKIKGKLTPGAPALSSLVDREMCIVLPTGDLYMRLNATTLVYLGGNGKANLDSPALTGIPTAPTPANTSNDTQIATTAFVKAITSQIDLSSYATITALNAAINSLVNSSPAVLDTLAELANALGNDENFAVNMTNLIAQKLDQNSTIDGGTFS
jgi:hypothetical protein